MAREARTLVLESISISTFLCFEPNASLRLEAGVRMPSAVCTLLRIDHKLDRGVDFPAGACGDRDEEIGVEVVYLRGETGE